MQLAGPHRLTDEPDRVVQSRISRFVSLDVLLNLCCGY